MNDLDEMEWLPPTKSGRVENALLQAAWERIMARNFDRQIAELQVRAAVLNRFTRLGMPITVAMP